MIAADRSVVRWGTTIIPYVIRRSARRATVAIAIEPGGAVVLTAPIATPIPRLDDVVRRKARWIVDGLRSVEDITAPPALREFVSGETFLYRGRQHRLRVVRGVPEGVQLDHGRLTVHVAGAKPWSARVRALLVAWYRERARAVVPSIAAEWAQRVDVAPTAVLIRGQDRRWGSCTARGEVRFNWRIVQAARTLIEYVVAHELVHLLHPNHTAAYWAALGRVMPDYEARRARLRRDGGAMVW